MKVSVDNELCSGHARCNAVEPKLFTLDDLGNSNIGQGKTVPEGLEDQARHGVRACPERALSTD